LPRSSSVTDANDSGPVANRPGANEKQSRYTARTAARTNRCPAPINRREWARIYRRERADHSEKVYPGYLALRTCACTPSVGHQGLVICNRSHTGYFFCVTVVLENVLAHGCRPNPDINKKERQMSDQPRPSATPVEAYFDRTPHPFGGPPRRSGGQATRPRKPNRISRGT
jgi:hypothetical protein